MKTMRLLFAMALVLIVVASVTIAQAPPAGAQGGAAAPPAGGRGGGAPGGPGGGGQGRGGAGGGRGGGPSLMITSPSFPDGGEVPMKFAGARGGENKSPEFKFNWIQGMNPAERPATVQTYAIIFHDIENFARGGGLEDTLHWSIYNIPGTATGLPEGLPAGALPDGSTPGPGIRGGPTGSYFGPGAGATLRHNHYIFEFYALDTKLDFPAGAPTRAQLQAAMEGHVVGKAAYVGRFRSPAPPTP
jgi:phosphatidylethanolamine-binding protein (PEBP) family uncharacterized protein